jgi:hypothetical protein
MKRSLVLTALLSFLILHLSIPALHPATKTQTMSFDSGKLLVTSLSGYDRLIMEGCDLTDRVGEPLLPVYIDHVSLPSGATVTSVKLIRTRDRILPGRFHPFPVQPPAILGIPGRDIPAPGFVDPDARIYRSTSPYPEKVVEVAGAGYLGDSSIGSVLIYPITYLPGEGTLVFHERVDYEIEYEVTDFRAIGRVRVSPGTSSMENRIIHSLTGDEWITEGQAGGRGSLQEMDPDLYPYIVITSNNLEWIFRPLVDWKTRKGVRGRIITTQFIEQNYTGVDLAEKIRNFIIDAHQTAGAQWILLGGDTNLVPARIAWAMDCEMGWPGDNDLQADLYYSDLDGDWNANANGTFGEIDDEVDLFPDIFVGRAPVEDDSEAAAFVMKTIIYERYPPTDYQTNMTMAAEILWPDPYTDAGIGADMIDSLYIPPQFDPINKLYMSLGNENYETVMAALNEGQNLFNHDGHCWHNYMSMGEGGLENEDMDLLVNGDRQGILYSIGCWPAAIDYDCIAEHFVTNLNGGGIAFIGNSRYGWGSPGNPGFGYSERFVQQFYRHLFQEGFIRPSVALAMSKSFYVSRSQTENVYRWHQYQVNLLGDPELSLWTDIPVTAIVDHPVSISGEEQVLPITVRVNGDPMADAQVCVEGNTVYQVGWTDETGRVILSPVPASDESLFVTVTGENILPYEGVITIEHSGPFLTMVSAEIDDSPGNDDGLINPGEEVTLTIEVRNTGTENLTDVSANLHLQDEYCVLLDSVETFGDIAVGDTAYGSSGIRIQVGSECPGGHLLYLQAVLTDGSMNIWNGSLSFLIRSPTLGCTSHLLDDSIAGDGDGLLDPGETASLRLIICNSGQGCAHDVSAVVTSLDTDLIVPDTTIGLGTMNQGDVDTIDIAISADVHAEAPSFPSLLLELNDGEGSHETDTLVITLGTEAIRDDFEDGEGRWTHQGTNDDWHLSTYRSHSGETSWYCGNESNHTYRNHTEADLIPPAIFIAPNPRFSFWCWYDVTTYGVDGVYVEANDGSGWIKLDFIGSGGALDSLLNVGNDWHEESYDLSMYPVGTRVDLRLRFSSDDVDYAEGVYIDDVSSNCPVDTTTTSIGDGDDRGISLPKTLTLYQNYPNPFNPSTTISFDLPGNRGERRHASLVIYDMRGRRMRTLIDSELEPGRYDVAWNGRDERGETVSSGIYLYRLRSEEKTFIRKMIVLK